MDFILGYLTVYSLHRSALNQLLLLEKEVSIFNSLAVLAEREFLILA